MSTSYNPYNQLFLTPEKIQQILEENQQFILAIIENQNLGRLHDCVQYQKKLHQNLVFLATLADSCQNTGPNSIPLSSILSGTTSSSLVSFPLLTQLLQNQPGFPPIQIGSSIPTTSTHSSTTAEHKTMRVSYWTPEEHQKLLEAIRIYGVKDIKSIAKYVGTRSVVQVRSHLQKFLQKLKKQQQQKEQEQQPQQPQQQTSSEVSQTTTSTISVDNNNTRNN